MIYFVVSGGVVYAVMGKEVSFARGLADGQVGWNFKRGAGSAPLNGH